MNADASKETSINHRYLLASRIILETILLVHVVGYDFVFVS